MLTLGSWLRWLRGWWHAKQRHTDIRLLWPACKDKASSLDYARAVFAAHAFNDTAWTDEMTEDEINQVIEELQ